MFSPYTVNIFLALFFTVGHLLTLVQLDQCAMPSVGMVNSVATAHHWAVMCVGGTPLIHHFADTERAGGASIHAGWNCERNLMNRI
jgi:hypothetical protein